MLLDYKEEPENLQQETENIELPPIIGPQEFKLPKFNNQNILELKG